MTPEIDGPQEESVAGRPKFRLDAFLKFTGAAATGGQAKIRIQSGDVRVNGEVETRRGRGMHPGDRVEIDGRVYLVERSHWR